MQSLLITADNNGVRGMGLPRLVKWRVDPDSGGEAVAPLTGFVRVTDRGQREAAVTGTVIGLFDELRPSLFRYLRWIGCSPEESDDAIQETFLRLHAHLRSGGPSENLRAWLFRVAGNLIRDSRRSSRTRKQEPLSTETGDFAASELDPEQIALARESNRRLEAAIRRLPLDQRKCLALRAQGMRYREIGESIGIGTTTVSDLLQRAVRSLSQEFSSELPRKTT